MSAAIDSRIDRKVGPFGMGEVNGQGEKVVEWCKEHSLVVMNTWFKNHPT